MSDSPLLELQALDTRIDQLRHRRSTLPQRDSLRELARAATEAKTEVESVRSGHDELAREQRRLEDELSSLETKIGTETDRLYSGRITAPKELEAIQEEIASLKRRQSRLEDELLELFERIEPLAESLESTEARLVDIGRRAAALRGELEAEEADIDRDIDAELGAREDVASRVASTHLAEYERLRESRGGVVAARLQGSLCTGCQLELPDAEVERLRRLGADEIGYCDCGVIVVTD